MTDDTTPRRRLPEDSQFRAVLIGCCIAAGLFITAFVIITLVAWSSEVGLLTSGWYEAWGSWAGGAATAAAFLIAAFSIRVSSAHEHADRADAALIRENQDMAQARLLIIYQVEMPTQPQSFRFYRIDNRSKDLIFDVRVPYVERYYGSGQTSRLTPEDFSGTGTVTMEFLPEGELLTPYRTQSKEEGWYTEVRVYADPGAPVQFAVQYTDAAGLQWKQHLDGQIERLPTTEAVPAAPRRADSVQPVSQLQLLTEDEAATAFRGGFGGGVPQAIDDQAMEAVAPMIVATWARVSRIGTPQVLRESEPGAYYLEIAYTPTAPSPWGDYFHDELQRAGVSLDSVTHSQGLVEAIAVEVREDDVERIIGIVDKALEFANEQFEATDLKAAHDAIERVAARETEEANSRARLDDLLAGFAKPGRVPWHRQTPPPARESGQP